MTIPGLVPELLGTAVQQNTFWADYIQQVLQPEAGAVALHLAILVNPYLQLLLDGQKTIESRFSVQRRAPFDQVTEGDIILLKRSGGPILGIGIVAKACFYETTPEVLKDIQATYAEALGIRDPSFWAARAQTRFATLLWLEQVTTITPIPYHKRDQRAWVILKQRIQQQQLWESAPPHCLPTSASD
jgi:ASC-1-like (ASCH) protein